LNSTCTSKLARPLPDSLFLGPVTGQQEHGFRVPLPDRRERFHENVVLLHGIEAGHAADDLGVGIESKLHSVRGRAGRQLTDVDAVHDDGAAPRQGHTEPQRLPVLGRRDIDHRVR
jgi:hypothetical protein